MSKFNALKCQFIFQILYVSNSLFSIVFSCSFDVKTAQILHGNGFHRNISYSITIATNDEDTWLFSNCIMALDQTLPPGIYVNPDELGDLRRLNKVNIIPKTRVNTEMPAEQSSESSVFIIGLVVDSKVNVWLPVHARYHKPVAGGGMTRNVIGAPSMYLRCPDERLNMCTKTLAPVTFLCNSSSKEKCSWKAIPHTMVTDTLAWSVPVGDTDHYYVVSIGTFIVIVIGSLYLLKTIHEYKINAKRKLK